MELYHRGRSKPTNAEVDYLGLVGWGTVDGG